jgi:hypothetical protein
MRLLLLALREPFRREEVTELMKFVAFLARQDDAAGAKAVTEGVHAGSGLASECPRAGRFQRVSAVCLDLFARCHIVFGRSKPMLAAGAKSRLRLFSWLHDSAAGWRISLGAEAVFGLNALF